MSRIRNEIVWKVADRMFEGRKSLQDRDIIDFTSRIRYEEGWILAFLCMFSEIKLGCAH